jgi:hypothetical protein
MSDSFNQEAFNRVCRQAIQAKAFYVTLMESCPFYGGPEEGGWWGTDQRIVAYQHFPTEEQAEAAKEAVDKLAEELSTESRKAFGDQCLRDMEWLDARGLDSDFLPEVDGESNFFVVLSEGLPEESFGPRHYE